MSGSSIPQGRDFYARMKKATDRICNNRLQASLTAQRAEAQPHRKYHGIDTNAHLLTPIHIARECRRLWCVCTRQAPRRSEGSCPNKKTASLVGSSAGLQPRQCCCRTGSERWCQKVLDLWPYAGHRHGYASAGGRQAHARPSLSVCAGRNLKTANIRLGPGLAEEQGLSYASAPKAHTATWPRKLQEMRGLDLCPNIAEVFTIPVNGQPSRSR
jgi:hypothetical protein